jgi:1-deoxy-D-xylulose-5-phosphate reductoisomerase
MRKKIAVLGSTGAVGTVALQVVSHLKEQVQVEVLAARSNIDLLEKQALEFRPKILVVYDRQKALELEKRRLGIEILTGDEGLKAVACLPSVDFVLLAMSGSIGIFPAIEAVKTGKKIGIANKEILVSAGEIITSLARKSGAVLLPVDSELSAVFQCLKGESFSEVKKLILTASGGPFRAFKNFTNIQPRQVLKHPNYRVGPKAGVDSSTLMNKGLEMIGARWLFDMPAENIETVVHPEQRIQSCIEFVDGSVKALISEPDMAFPIQYAITYPERVRGKSSGYDFVKNGTLSFFPPDLKNFRCLKIAIDAMRHGRSYPCFLNAANEVLVEKFLIGQIRWEEIGIFLEKLISSHEPCDLLTLEAILETDGLARKKASVVCH